MIFLNSAYLRGNLGEGTHKDSRVREFGLMRLGFRLDRLQVLEVAGFRILSGFAGL